VKLPRFWHGVEAAAHHDGESNIDDLYEEFDSKRELFEAARRSSQ